MLVSFIAAEKAFDSQAAWLQVESVEGTEKLDARHGAAVLITGPLLVAHGSGWDASGAWRHAGGLPCRRSQVCGQYRKRQYNSIQSNSIQFIYPCLSR